MRLASPGQGLLALATLLALLVPASAQPTAAPELIAQAESEALRLREPAQCAMALADVAMAWRQLDDPRWEKAWAQALMAAEKITESVAAPLTWRGLAVRLWPIAPNQAQAMFDKAIAQATALPYAAQKALVLREIGRALLGRDDALARRTMDQAAEAARTIQSPIFLAASLRDIAVALSGSDREASDRLFAEAVGALPPADPDENTQLARSEVAVAWCRHDLATALTEAELIGDAPLREACYRRMCEALAPVSPDQAMQVMVRIHDETQRVLALAALAAALATTQPETAAGMARSALASADQLPPADREILQAEAAVALAPQALPEALALLEQVDDERVAGEAFRRIIVRLAQSQPGEALRVLTGVEDWQAREEALLDILPQLAQHDRARATALANQLLSRRDRIRALLVLAASHPKEEAEQP
jgi:hypothetical protein